MGPCGGGGGRSRIGGRRGAPASRYLLFWVDPLCWDDSTPVVSATTNRRRAR